VRLFWLCLCLPNLFAQDSKLEGLSFLSGCWALQNGALVIEEQWTQPSANDMLGTGRTIRGGKTVFYEFMRIERKADEITYTPRIGSTPKPVVFRLIQQGPGEVIFENPEHDFPQRILYRKTADGLHARIEGIDKGKERSQDFRYKAVSCTDKH
jgi:hypothetical protein